MAKKPMGLNMMAKSGHRIQPKSAWGPRREKYTTPKNKGTSILKKTCLNQIKINGCKLHYPQQNKVSRFCKWNKLK